MYSTKTKRRMLLQRIITYAIMTIIVAVASYILVLLMLGYRYNGYSGTVQQGGLVQFVTQPSGASVSVGDIQLANKTRSKITLNPGNYLIKMQLEGYRTWQKNVTVEAGTVLWLNSVQFVPTQPETMAVTPIKQLASTSARPGLRTFALLEDAKIPQIRLVDIGGDDAKQTLVRLATRQYHEAKKHTFTLGEWLNDRQVLLRHQYDKSEEWIVVDVKDVAQSYTVTPIDNARPLMVIADPRSNSSVLVQRSDGSVTAEQMRSGEKTTLPIRNVTQMMSDGSVLYFVATTDSGAVTTNYLTLGAAAARQLASYPKGSDVRIASNEYFRVRYIATTVDSTATVAKLTALPDSASDAPLQLETVKTIALTSPAKALSFQGQSRLVVVAQAQAQMTYDIQLGMQNNVLIDGAVRELTRQPTWLDTFHYWSDANGQLRLYEFDGTNQADIASVAPGFSAVYGQDNRYIYSIGKTNDGYQLQRTRMIVE